MPSALAIHGVCTVLWVGSPWDPKYLLLLTFTTLNVLSDPCGNFCLHKSRDFKKVQRPFPDFLLKSIALACLLRYTHFGNNKMFHLRIIVISSQSFFNGFSDFGCRYRQLFLAIFGLLVQIPTALFGRCSPFDEPTSNTFLPF